MDSRDYLNDKNLRDYCDVTSLELSKTLGHLLGELDYANANQNTFVRDRALAMALNAAERALTLIQNLRYFTSYFPKELEWTDLTQLIMDTAEWVERELEARKIALVLNVENDCVAYLDGQAIQQALQSTLLFLSHLGEKNTKIEVELSSNSGKFQITFNLNVPRLSENDLLNNPKIPVEHSLGFTASRTLVESQGGTITTTSKMGKGLQIQWNLVRSYSKLPKPQYPIKRKHRRVQTQVTAVAHFKAFGSIKGTLTVLGKGGGLMLIPISLYTPQLKETVSIELYSENLAILTVPSAQVVNLQQMGEFFAVGVQFDELGDREEALISALVRSHSL